MIAAIGGPCVAAVRDRRFAGTLVMLRFVGDPERRSAGD
jgi:hypothetical protein